MPFTPSHAIVALPFVGAPLSRTGFVPAAVAVGAMAPDLPLFVRGTPLTYTVTHDLRWIPLTTVVALALLVVWRCLLRPAAHELSPRWLAERLPRGWDAGARASLTETFAPGRRGLGPVLLAASLVLGVLTHIGWDAFTHEGRVGSALVPALGRQWGALPGYRWLQYGSSTIGLIVLAAAAAVWLRGRIPQPVPRTGPAALRVGWWLSLLAPLGVGVLAFLPFDAPPATERIAYAVLPPLYAAWGGATVALCIAVQVRSRPAAR